MFGWLHIEKLLLGIYGKLIGGSGLPRFLNYLKLSITGARNLALSVPNITLVYVQNLKLWCCYWKMKKQFFTLKNG